MPFDSNKEVSTKVKGISKLSDKKKRQWRHVFNSCYEKNGDKSSCYAQAWGAVNKTACVRCSPELRLASELLLIARCVVVGDGD